MSRRPRAKLPSCIEVACDRGLLAHKTYIDLVMEGVDVRAIDFTARVPVIEVNPSPQFFKLIKRALARAISIGGAQTIWRAEFKDCLVQWKGN